MKSLKRYLLVLLSVCLLACALVACDGDNGDNGDNGGDTAITEYIFNVVLEDTQAAVEGVRVQICRGEDFCLMPVNSDASGKVVYSLGANKPDEYEVHILEGSIPEGYTFDNTSVKTTADKQQYTLTLKKNSQTSGDGASDCAHIYVNDRCTKCGEYKKYDHSVKINYGQYINDKDKAGTPASGISLLITDGVSRIATGETDGNGIFTFSAPKYTAKDGNIGYTVMIRDGVPDGFYIQSDVVFSPNALICNVEVYQSAVKDPYTAFYPGELSIGSTIQITMSEKREDDGDGLLSTSHDDSLYYFSVQPSKPDDVGYYRLSAIGLGDGAKLYIGHFPSSSNYISFSADIDNVDESGEYASYIEFMMQKEYMTDSDGNFKYYNSWMFGVRFDSDAEYPTTVTLKLEKLRDIIPGKDVPIKETESVQIASGTKNAADIVGDVSGKTLTDFSFEEINSAVIVKDENGYYHVGSADGAFVMLKISVKSRFFSLDNISEDVSFVNINSTSGMQYLSLVFSETRNVNGEELDYRVVKYYKGMIDQYAELCIDGAYVLNDQLYDFITEWVVQKRPTLPSGINADTAFLYGCAYYTEA